MFFTKKTLIVGYVYIIEESFGTTFNININNLTGGVVHPPPSSHRELSVKSPIEERVDVNEYYYKNIIFYNGRK